MVGRRQHAPPGQRPHVRPGRGDRHQQSEDGHARGGRYRGPAGNKALETMKDIFDGCKMKNFRWKAALRSFSAGKIAMMYWSTSALCAFERAKGDFDFRHKNFQVLKVGPRACRLGEMRDQPMNVHSEKRRFDEYLEHQPRNTINPMRIAVWPIIERRIRPPNRTMTRFPPHCG